MYPQNFSNTKMTIGGTIALNGTKTEGLDTHNCQICGVEIPSALTGTAISFEESVDGVTYLNVINPADGADYSVTIATPGYHPLDNDVFHGCRFLKIVSNGSEAAERSIGLRVKAS